MNEQVEGVDIRPGDIREVIHPINRKGTYDMYLQSQKMFWTSSEIQIIADIEHYRKMDDVQRQIVNKLLAFFSASDELVNNNIGHVFKQAFPIREVQLFYNFQVAIEDIHADVYSKLLEVIIPAEELREELRNAYRTDPVIKSMADYIYKTGFDNIPIGERLIRSACIEGIFFTGCFALIYWLQDRGKMPGLGQANELIARDETMHTQFTAHLYNEYILPTARPSRETVLQVVQEAVDIATNFMKSLLKRDIEGLTIDNLKVHIQSQADALLGLIHQKPMYGVFTPFKTLSKMVLLSKSLFFERTPTEYQQPGEHESNF